MINEIGVNMQNLVDFITWGFVGGLAGAGIGLMIVMKMGKNDHEWWMKMQDDYARHFDGLIKIKARKIRGKK